MIKKNYCVVFFLFFYSLSFSQTVLESRNISLQLYETSLIDIIKAIEAQSGVTFVYNTTLMKNAQEMCINVTDADINILLQTICSKSGNNYKVINNQVVFFKVATPPTESIKILIEPITEKQESSVSRHAPVSKSIIHPEKNVSDPSTLLETTDVFTPDSNAGVITDTLSTALHTTDSLLNKVHVFPISAKVASRVCPDSLRLSFTDYNITEQNSTMGKHSSNKYFYSIQINNFLGISPGFNKSNTLSAEEAQMLNNSVSSYGFSGGINLGYTIKRFSFKTGLLYTQFNEEFSIKKTYKVFSKQTHWQGITWQEQSPDGIIIHTDTVPVTQTVVTDSVATFTQKYSYTYLEIPFGIDYTIPLKAKWRVFGSLGVTYAITLKNNFNTPLSVYKPKPFNKLDISVGVSAGLKFCTNRLHYYFMAGGRVRTSLNPNSKFISRNPIYLNLAVGVINYF